MKKKVKNYSIQKLYFLKCMSKSKTLAKQGNNFIISKHTLFQYKNNFIRTTRLKIAQKKEQCKNNAEPETTQFQAI